MNNISYIITELNNNIDNHNDTNTDNNSDELHNNTNNTNIIDHNDFCNIDFLVYNSYTVKQLYLILQYYDICKGRMCKDEIIQTILLFETDEDNLNIVNKRKYLWSIATQLKNDDFFCKYIVIDIK
tara:strand:+ start:2852 stop:3229 length:378 start_codon:yes stop_codon:yes gene_type:complete